MQKKLVLLDFDGVIADTFHIGHAVAKKLCVFVTESEYRNMFTGNVYDAHDVITAADHGDKCDHLLDWWGEYLPGFNNHARPFAGVPEIVKEFAKDYTLCIVSSCRGSLIRDFLQKYDLTSSIDGVYGVDVDTHKDKKFRAIFEKYGVGPKDCLFITDTLGDINEATSVGLSSIGVTWGFQDKETLLRGNPLKVVELPGELPNAVTEFFR